MSWVQVTELLQAREKNDDVIERIEELVGEDGKKSELIREAVYDLINDPRIWDEKIEEEKRHRDNLMAEKQELERRLERSRDRLTDLKDRRSEARTLKKVERSIPSKRIDRIRDLIREHKYDSDPRSLPEGEIIERHAEKIAEDQGFDVEMVERVLRLRINV